MAKKQKKKKHLSPNQLEWEKQSKRISRFIKSASKRGFRFTDLPFEVDKFFKPVPPQRVLKKDIQRLKEFTQKTAYEYAEYTIPMPIYLWEQEVYYEYDIEWGEVIGGTVGRYLERLIAARKGQHTKNNDPDDNIPNYIPQGEQVYYEAQQILLTISPWSPSPESTAAISMLEYQRSIDDRGLYFRLANADEVVIAQAQGIVYSSKQEQREYHLSQFLIIINGKALTLEETRSITEQYYDTI